MLVGTELQHVVAQLALEVVEAVGPVGTHLKPRDDLFWFKKPEILLWLIQFISFQVILRFFLCCWTFSHIKFVCCCFRFLFLHLICFLQFLFFFTECIWDGNIYMVSGKLWIDHAIYWFWLVPSWSGAISVIPNRDNTSPPEAFHSSFSFIVLLSWSDIPSSRQI